MRALLEECARQFDWVLIDTPPVGLLPDAQLLARLAGAVVLVIGAGSTPAATVERAVAEIGPGAAFLEQRGNHMLTWKAHGTSYTAVGHLPQDVLVQLAKSTL